MQAEEFPHDDGPCQRMSMRGGQSEGSHDSVDGSSVHTCGQRLGCHGVFWERWDRKRGQDRLNEHGDFPTTSPDCIGKGEFGQ